MLRFVLRSFAIALAALILAPVASLAGPPMTVFNHAASGALARDAGSFSSLHTSTGAGAAIDLTLPDCATDTVLNNRQIRRGNVGAVFVIAATDQNIHVLVADETNTLFVLNGTALDVGDEVDLAANGDVAIFICAEQDRWVVEGAGGADGGAD